MMLANESNKYNDASYNFITKIICWFYVLLIMHIALILAIAQAILLSQNFNFLLATIFASASEISLQLFLVLDSDYYRYLVYYCFDECSFFKNDDACLSIPILFNFNVHYQY